MDNGQNLAKDIEQIDVAMNDAKPFVLTEQQQAWIDYNALSGLITDNTDERRSEGGEIVTLRKLPIYEFAEMLGVSRETLRNWRTSIPNFWQLVNDRRKELAPHSRLMRVHETWYLKAVAGSWPHMEAWLRNFDPEYKEPRAKVEHELGDSWAALARQKVIATSNPKVIDAETTDKPSGV